MTQTALILAITGGSGSGKSTLADGLIDLLRPAKAVRFNEDCYYHPLAHYGTYTTIAERDALIAGINFDDPAAKDEDALLRDLTALRAGRPVQQPVYDFDTHDRLAEVTRTLSPAPIIIMEGIHVLSIAQIRPLIDLSVYVDTPDDLRLARRLRRDVVERGRDVESVLAQYLKSVRPAHYAFTHPAKFAADLVIADEGLPAYGDVRPSREAIARMTSPVLERLQAMGAL